jgi:transcription antitermination protein NusB
MQRRAARELLLSALYRCEFLSTTMAEVFEETDPEDQRTYIENTFEGINEHRVDIDRMLADKTIGWKFERLALLDRNILRIGVYELLYADDIPPEVALDEAVELAKKYGTEPARAYINGILDRIWRENRARTTS